MFYSLSIPDTSEPSDSERKQFVEILGKSILLLSGFSSGSFSEDKKTSGDNRISVDPIDGKESIKGK